MGWDVAEGLAIPPRCVAFLERRAVHPPVLAADGRRPLRVVETDRGPAELTGPGLQLPPAVAGGQNGELSVDIAGRKVLARPVMWDGQPPPACVVEGSSHTRRRGGRAFMADPTPEGPAGIPKQLLPRPSHGSGVDQQ